MFCDALWKHLTQRKTGYLNIQKWGTGVAQCSSPFRAFPEDVSSLSDQFTAGGQRLEFTPTALDDYALLHCVCSYGETTVSQ